MRQHTNGFEYNAEDPGVLINRPAAVGALAEDHHDKGGGDERAEEDGGAEFPGVFALAGPGVAEHDEDYVDAGEDVEDLEGCVPEEVDAGGVDADCEGKGEVAAAEDDEVEELCYERDSCKMVSVSLKSGLVLAWPLSVSRRGDPDGRWGSSLLADLLQSSLCGSAT